MSRPLGLEQLFPLLINERVLPAAGGLAAAEGWSEGIGLPFSSRLGSSLFMMSLNAPLWRGRPKGGGRTPMACFLAMVLCAVFWIELGAWMRTRGPIVLLLGVVAVFLYLSAWHRPERIRLHTATPVRSAVFKGQALVTVEAPRWLAMARRGWPLVMVGAARQLFTSLIMAKRGYLRPSHLAIGALIWVSFMGIWQTQILPRHYRAPVSRRKRLEKSLSILRRSWICYGLGAGLLVLADAAGIALAGKAPATGNIHALADAVALALIFYPVSTWSQVAQQNRASRFMRVTGRSFPLLFALAAILSGIGHSLSVPWMLNLVRFLRWRLPGTVMAEGFAIAAALAIGFYLLCEDSLRRHFLRHDLIGR